MFVSLYNELVLLLYQEIGFQSDEDLQVYLWVCVHSKWFFVFPITTKAAFWLMDSSLGYII